ncbi:MAG: hypothetical protein AB2552_12405 [Candidatus Thiodiazotropha endolucinida]
MASKKLIKIIKYVTSIQYEQVTNGIPSSWNSDGEAYQILSRLFGEERVSDVTDIELEVLSEHVSTIKESINVLGTHNAPATVLLDFSEYRVTVNLFDDIAPSLENALSAGCKAIVILLPLGKLTEIKNSYYVEQLDKFLKGKTTGLLIVEQDGKYSSIGNYSFQNITECISKLAVLFSQPSQSDFKKYLIKRSDRWFGHFKMKSGVHVRTHYDCYEKILNDNWLYRYVSAESGKFMEEQSPDILIGFGLVSNAVNHLTLSLASEYSIPHLLKTKGEPLNFSNFDGKLKVLLVSDVVLTTTSASQLAEKIEASGHKIVGLLCVLGLQNSKSTFHDCLPIKMLTQLDRPFYLPEEYCPLCDCKYPTTEVKRYEDFRVLPENINAYDFWEAVAESKAFSSIHQELNGRHYTYFIDIRKLLNIYGTSISRQLIHQARNTLEYTAPSVVLFPDSPAACEFAEIISDRLKDSYGELLLQPISDTFLNAITHADRFSPPSDFDVDNVRGASVLVVDDGCCSFDTFSAIEELLKRLKCNLVVYLVILNRSSKEVNARKIKQLGGKFQSYYHWPVKIYPDNNSCLECTG